MGLAAGSLSPYTRLVDLLSTLQGFEDKGNYTFISKHFDWLGILSGVLTVASLPAMWVAMFSSGRLHVLIFCRVGLDFVKQGVITSIIAVEFVWLSKSIICALSKHVSLEADRGIFVSCCVVGLLDRYCSIHGQGISWHRSRLPFYGGDPWSRRPVQPDTYCRGSVNRYVHRQ